MTGGELAAWITLAVTLFGVVIAFVAYRYQIAMIEPWSMTKIEDNLWMLERNRPKLATIYGYVGGYLCDRYDVTFLNPAVQPAGYFKKGTKILVQTGSLPKGASFVIAYREHYREGLLFKYPYRGRLDAPSIESLPRGVKTWTTCLY